MKTTNATHTPLPWALTNCGSHMQIHREGWPRDAWTVANLQTQAQDEANGELIVRAVNSHDELIAALQHLLAERYVAGDAADQEFDADGNFTSNSPASVKARLALARAKGVQS